MTAFEQWANYFRENYRAFNPDEHDIAELAFDAALEHAAKICDELATSHKKDTGCCDVSCDFVAAFETCAEAIREEISK